MKNYKRHQLARAVTFTEALIFKLLFCLQKERGKKKRQVRIVFLLKRKVFLLDFFCFLYINSLESYALNKNIRFSGIKWTG